MRTHGGKMKAVAVTGPIAAHAAQDVNSNDTEDRGRDRIAFWKLL